MSITTAPTLEIKKIYLKDVTFDHPSSPGVFAKKDLPSMDFSLQAFVEPVEGPFYEICLKAQVKCRIDKQLAYFLEIEQAGLFELIDVADADIDKTLRIDGATIVYPSLRFTIADLTFRAGFDPYTPSDVNFNRMYQLYLKEKV